MKFLIRWRMWRFHFFRQIHFSYDTDHASASSFSFPFNLHQIPKNIESRMKEVRPSPEVGFDCHCHCVMKIGRFPGWVAMKFRRWWQIFRWGGWIVCSTRFWFILKIRRNPVMRVMSLTEPGSTWPSSPSTYSNRE